MELNFEKVKTLPQSLVPGTVYLVDDEKTIVVQGTNETFYYDNSPKIEEEIKKLIGNVEEEVTLSDLLEKINQLKEDSPFEKGTGNNSAVLKGTSNSATNNFATAFGEQTTASAVRAFSEGLKTTASGANSHAEGLSTLAQGQNSHAEGCKSQAIGHHSHAEGNGTIANGGASHAEGSGTITTNDFEHAEGRYNVSNKDRDSDYWGGNNTVHSVGIGSTNERKNAHEILQNGKHYIYGIGGYNGTNVLDLDGETATAYDLATVVNDKVSKNELDALSNNINERIADEIANLVDSAPEALDTLRELADAIQENEDVIDVLNSAITNKVDKVEGKDLSTNDYTDEDKEKTEKILSGLWSIEGTPSSNLFAKQAKFGSGEISGALSHSGWNDSGFIIKCEDESATAATGYVFLGMSDSEDQYGTVDKKSIILAAYDDYTQNVRIYRLETYLHDIVTQAEIDALFDGSSSGTSSSY